ARNLCSTESLESVGINVRPESGDDRHFPSLQVRKVRQENSLMDLLRSWMFVPGHRQRMIDKAFGLKTDAIMLDIEDGVAPNEKDAARKNIAESLGREKTAGSPARYVRINAIGHARMDADLEAVVRPGLEGLACPKVYTPEED